MSVLIDRAVSPVVGEELNQVPQPDAAMGAWSWRHVRGGKRRGLQIEIHPDEQGLLENPARLTQIASSREPLTVHSRRPRDRCGLRHFGLPTAFPRTQRAPPWLL